MKETVHSIGIKLSTFLLVMLFSHNVFSQISIALDHDDSNYEVGETVQFLVSTTFSMNVNYTIDRGQYTPVLASGSINVNPGAATTVSFPTSEAGNVRIQANGVTAVAMVGRKVIQPFEPEPSDYDAFWDAAKAELAQVPMNAQLSPHSSTAYSTSYSVSLGNIDGRNVYGVLTIPNGDGPFPAVVLMPAYGSFPIAPDVQYAERTNTITLRITIHNAPANTTDPNAYSPDDPSDEDLNYHRHSITAGIRAIDYLFTRNDFNGTDMAVAGVSQGGGLGTLLAGIDQRVKLLVIAAPAMSSHAGLYHDHPSGFPFYLRIPLINGNQQEIQDYLHATKYYEAAYAAKRFLGPVFVLTGYHDQVTITETQFVTNAQFPGKKVILHHKKGTHDDRPQEYLIGQLDYFRRHFEAANTPPFIWAATTKGYVADAGADQSINSGGTAGLSGTIEDDTNVNPNIPVQWRLVEGPGTVNFSSPNNYSTNATFSQDGTYVLEFSGQDNYSDNSNLFYTMSDRVVISVGTGTNPAPTVTLTTPNSNVTGSFVVQANFSQPVSGLDLSDFNVTNGSPSGLSGSGSSYSLTITPNAVGTVTVQLPQNAAANSGGQGNLNSNVLSVQYATANTAPTVNLTTASNQVNGPYVVQVQFNESVTGLSLNDFSVTNGNVSNLTGSGSSYSVTVTPINTGSVTIQLPANAAQDGQNLGNIASNLLIVNYTASTGGDIDLELSLSSDVASVDLYGSVTFILSLTNISQTTATGIQVDYKLPAGMGLILSYETAGMYNSWSGLWTLNQLAPGQTETVTVQANLNINQPVTYYSQVIAAHQDDDDSTPNNNPGPNPTEDDEAAVTVTITGSSTTPSVTLSTPTTQVTGDFVVQVQFSEAVSGLAITDFSASNLTLSNFSGSGTNYTVTATPINPGSTSISLPANVAHNPSGNGNTASNALQVQYTTTTNAGYCESRLTPWVEWINKVQFHTIDQGSSKEGYADFTDVTTEVEKGQTYELKIHYEFSYFHEDEYFRTWIDFNQDGDFNDAGEMVLEKFVPAGTDGTSPAPIIETIQIPNNATEGTTRMRVTMHRDSYPTPCVSSGHGEIEDYTLQIKGGDIAPPTGDYCEGDFTPWHEWISLIDFGSIYHASGKDGYADFTDQSTEVSAGETVQATIHLGHGYWLYDEYYKIWIDFNQDGDFEDVGEEVFSQFVPAEPNGSSPPPLTSSFSIASTAMEGPTRIRFAMKRDAWPTPCNLTGYGEMEDYTIHIKSGQTNPGSDDYCETTATPWHEWIKQVIFGQINQTSEKDGYADFTHLSTNVQRGGTYPISIFLGHGYWLYNQYYKVWIDFNQDGDFDDAGENVLSRHVPAPANGTSPGPVIGNISIPNNAPYGTTRMRITLRRDSWPTPCTDGAFGETEDYSVRIFTSGQVIDNPYKNLFGLNKNLHSVSLHWTPDTDNHTQYYVIEHQSGHGFQPIEIVEHVVNKSYFEFEHHSPVVGNNQYRLKTVKMDGTYLLSQIEEVSFDPIQTISTYPSLTNGPVKVAVSTTQSDEMIHLSVYDMTGRLILTQQGTTTGNQASYIDFDLTGQNEGIYTLILEINGNTETQKVVLKK